MTSEALKLSPQARYVDFVLNDFAQLTAALMTHASFLDFERENPRPGLVNLTTPGATLFFVSHQAWNTPDIVNPILEHLDNPTVAVILTETAEEITKTPEIADDRILRIHLPTNLQQMSFIINAFIDQKRDYATDRTVTDQEAVDNIKQIFRVSRELNGVRDTNKLLSLILLKAREMTCSDAGSIYVVDWNSDRAGHDNPRDGKIIFKITQNESVKQNLNEYQLPISEDSMVGNAVIHATSINIPDLYKLDPDPDKNPFRSRYNKMWDERNGYQCRSMLTLPMFDISHRVIGVIQLINRKRHKNKKLASLREFESEVLTYDQSTVEYAEIIAQQAGIALENAMLTEEKEQLFEGFVSASVKAIEQRDPTTSGHSFRVATLSVETIKIVNRVDSGRFKSIIFSDDAIKEVEYASLLHDFGKLGVREQVLVKAKKLYPWEMDLLMERFDHIRSRYEIEYLREVVDYFEKPYQFPPDISPQSFQRKRQERIQELDDCLNFILKANEPTVLEQGGFERLKDIANLSFTTERTSNRPFLVSEELKALSVSRGSLTREEFLEIQSHVTHTYEFLRTIPWGKKYANVPQIAAKHHEKLDGTGYPTAAEGQDIPVQTRIMTIADIFDALTASDRPYKKAVPVEKALDIINMDVKSGKLDKDLFDIFVESKVYETVIKPSL